MRSERETRPSTRRLWLVLTANFTLVAALIVVATSAHSVAVLAEGADDLADGAAIGVSLLAIHLSARPANSNRPQRHRRAPHYAAIVNAGWLLLLCLLVSAAAIARLLSGTHRVHGLPVLIVCGIAAMVLFAGALLLRDEIEDEHDLNRRAVLLDTAADAAAAAGARSPARSSTRPTDCSGSIPGSRSPSSDIAKA
jgi:cobalt-zinc-cadmium efflux system protein